MLIDWIILGVAAAAFLALVVIFIRKFPHAASLDLKSIPKHVQKEMKTALIEERLERKIANGFKSIFAKTEAGRRQFGAIMRSWQAKIKKLEEKYKESNTPKTAQAKEESRKKVSTLLEEATKFFQAENYAEAERKYIEAVSLDHKNVGAYDGLSQVYIAQKNWKNAEETLAFVIKMNPDDDHAYLILANVLQELDKMRDALDMVKKAVHLNPKNPKNIAALIEISLTFGEKFTARNAVQRMKQVNPENQRIKEWEEKIAQMGK
ncbi:MAG: hypothetical protein A3F54_03225 [Candidatus Kerfeldbacteria bacterium RIFCSPHIGHO2_12_FULL_48_17]|uniref:Uncharacterized protein n=1 Tax=Candidatus Kerfeldbacteria bacterium RIFCSPHIGHO2_12_FULL_48_17 TaxID=1798542 RepID=A0A1G2B6E7_9BACT|nr:MAG: hypothetical protein A3F54_03225 [Candidatus Kerfeldbacteria bacterium RIFCSPHIGHO2_12_FULL_48_17]